MPQKQPEISLHLRDKEWPFEGVNYVRQIARGVVVDEEGYFYFTRLERDDEFGRAILIETAGGGVEPGENPEEALLRELQEELGVTAEILGKIGVVEDDYNLIHRHNIGHYYLCRALSFGTRRLTETEEKHFHLSTLRLTYTEAVAAYKQATEFPLGRLIAQRELPMLHQAKAWLE